MTTPIFTHAGRITGHAGGLFAALLAGALGAAWAQHTATSGGFLLAGIAALAVALTCANRADRAERGPVR